MSHPLARRMLILGLILFLCSAVVASERRTAAAQPVAPAGATISVTVDRGGGATYHVGDPIRICYQARSGPVIAIYRIEVRLIDILPDGQRRVLLETPDLNRCINATVTHPLGWETIRAELRICDLGPQGRCTVAASNQVAFLVAEHGPPHPDGSISVSVDRGPWSTYAVGDRIQVCYEAHSAPFIAIYSLEVRLIDLLPDGASRILLESGDLKRCINATVTRPLGWETIRAELRLCDLKTPHDCNVIAADEVTFQVVDRHHPPAGRATIYTDRSSYTIGDRIRVCWDVPGPSTVKIINTLADGYSHVLFSGQDDGSGRCISGVITPPPGRECVRLEYSGRHGRGTREACFQVRGHATAPATVVIPKHQYHVGETVEICYTVPGAGLVTVSNVHIDGRAQVIKSGYHPGSRACVTFQILTPAPSQCFRVHYSTTRGAGSPVTCYRVL